MYVSTWRIVIFKIRHRILRAFSLLLINRHRCARLDFLGIYVAQFCFPYVDNYVNALYPAIKFLREECSRGEFKLSGTGMLSIESEEDFYSVPCGAFTVGSLERAFQNIVFLKNSTYSYLVDYKSERIYIKGIPIYKFEKLKPATLTDTELQSFIASFKGSYSDNQFETVNFNDLTRALFEFLGIDDRILGLFSVKAEPGFVGFTHGDLHQGNIMANKKGKPVLIDLDRCQAEKAPQVLDRIHYQVVEKEKAERKAWFEFLLQDELIEASASRNSILAYMVFRASCEVCYWRKGKLTISDKWGMSHYKRGLKCAIMSYLTMEP